MKKGKIDGNIVDVVTFDEYNKNNETYDSRFTAIEEGDLIYPVRKKTDSGPGMYLDGPVAYFVKPTGEEIKNYSNDNIINFDSLEGMRDLIDRSTSLRNMEREVLTTPDNIFMPKIGENDTPEMRALKEAIIDKHIDIDKYEQRFDQFINDRRLFDKSKITLNKLKSISSSLDIKCTVILEDASPDVPNPIGRQIIVNISGGGEE